MDGMRSWSLFCWVACVLLIYIDARSIFMFNIVFLVDAFCLALQVYNSQFFLVGVCLVTTSRLFQWLVFFLSFSSDHKPHRV